MGTRKRPADSLREMTIEPNYLKYPEGSALIRCGDTKVICAASVEDKVKDWLKGKGKGWVTAEYAMLPRANAQRSLREGQFGRWPAGRSQEIQRLVGRCLRGAVLSQCIGERTITIDCDVLQGDGGTRCASITGGFVALALALDKLVKAKKINRPPLKNMVAAVSVGIVKGECLLDLDYSEDSEAEVDLNLAAVDTGMIVEIQGTAENKSYSRDDLFRMTDLALSAMPRLFELQRSALLSAGVDVSTLLQQGD
jgi:ribonuclease PH